MNYLNDLNLQGGKSGGKSKKDHVSSPSSEMLRTFEKSVSSYVQASLHLPHVNFISLQVSSNLLSIV